MSRSLVGSSSTSTFEGLASARASISRPRSPPESTRNGVRACSRREQEILHVADDVFRAFRRRRRDRRARRSAPRAASSRGRGCRAPGRASPSRMLAPRRTVPASGASAPVRRPTSVVLPLPFGPTMPMRSPRSTRSKNRRRSARSPKALRDRLRLDDERARLLRLARPSIVALPAAPRYVAALLAQRLQLRHAAARCACAAR